MDSRKLRAVERDQRTMESDCLTFHLGSLVCGIFSRVLLRTSLVFVTLFTVHVPSLGQCVDASLCHRASENHP